MQRYSSIPVLAVLLSLLSLSSILAGSAQAAMFTQTFGQTLKLGDNVPEGLEVASFAVDRFAAALGSLTGVSFTLASDFSGGGVFYHPTMSLTFGYTPRHYLAVDVNGLANPPDLTLDHTLPAQSYTDTTPWGGSYWSPKAQEHYEQTVGVPVGDLAQYVGSSPFDLRVTIEDRSIYTANNPLAYINDKYVISNLTLTVAYTYAPAMTVPVPGSWAMMLAGLGLVGWRARRPRAAERTGSASG